MALADTQYLNAKKGYVNKRDENKLRWLEYKRSG